MDPDQGTEQVDDIIAADDETGFDEGFSDSGTPTATPGSDDAAAGDDATASADAAAAAAAAAPAVEYRQITKAEYDALMARAALVDEIKATQTSGFDRVFGKVGEVERTLKAITAGKRVEIAQEDIDALRDDFPPLAAALEKVRDLQVIGAAPPAVDQAAIDTMVNERVTQSAQRIRAELRLEQIHPDWATYQSEPEFLAWANAQPDAYKRQLAESVDVTFIADAMTKAKATRKPAPTPAPPAPDHASTRRSRMQAAVTPTGSGATPTTDPEAEFDAGFKGT